MKCLVIGIAIFGVNTFLNTLLAPPSTSGAGESLLSLLLTSVIFAPLIEEFFFRGVVYNLLNKFKSGWFSLVLSAVIFGIYHVDFYQMIFTTILGLVLAFVYQRTNNIAYPIALHMANNAFACAAASGISEMSEKILSAGSMIMILPAILLLVRGGKNIRSKTVMSGQRTNS